jgi:hypothetical protein
LAVRAPFRHEQVVRYDNLKAAVAQVLGFSRRRVETAGWIVSGPITASPPSTASQDCKALTRRAANSTVVVPPSIGLVF